MRTTHHDGHGLNESIAIVTPDQRHYTCVNTLVGGNCVRTASIQFQTGAPGAPESVPGVTDRAMIAIIIDRYEYFQTGKFATPENEQVLSLLREALVAIKDRMDARAARGVLGTAKI